MIDKWGIVFGTLAHETCTFSNGKVAISWAR